MKTATRKSQLILILFLTAATLSLSVAAHAGDGERAQSDDAVKLSQCRGTLEAINLEERTVTVKRMFLRKTFNLGETCTVVSGRDGHADLNELNQGEWTIITYREVADVCIASRVEQPRNQSTGAIQSLDMENMTLKVDAGVLPRTYAISSDCDVRMRDGESGLLSELKPGEQVTLFWAKAAGRDVIHRIEQHGDLYKGRVAAVDLSAETVKIKVLLGEKIFRLGRDCRVVIDRKISTLSELNLGEPATVDYQEVNGVFIAHRVAQTQAEPGTDELISKAE